MATGRFATDKAGYAAMRRHVAAYPDRVWAVEGSNGAGRPLAQRLLADGEAVVDVPAKLSARARMFDTGHNRKTDPHDARAVAVVAVDRSPVLGAVRNSSSHPESTCGQGVAGLCTVAPVSRNGGPATGEGYRSARSEAL